MPEASHAQIAKQGLIDSIAKGLFIWMDFAPGARALFISSGSPLELSLENSLAEAGLLLTHANYDDFNIQATEGAFDYAFIGPALEYAKGDISAPAMLNAARRALKPGGKLMLFLDNRLGIRYFCGDADPCAGIVFDGIENYPYKSRDVSRARRRLYDKAETRELLQSVGFACLKFYSVFPGLDNPQLLIADGCKPNESLDVRIFTAYRKPDSVFLMEEVLYSSLVRNELFHPMANAFLVECASDEAGKSSFTKADYVTLSLNRGEKLAFATIIQNDDSVIKKPVCGEGLASLENIAANAHRLKQRGIPALEGKIENGKYVMKRIRGDSLVTVLRDLMRRDLNAFLTLMDRLWQYIVNSSEILPYANVDWERIDPSWDDLEKNGIKADREKWRRIAMKDGGEGNVLGPILKDGLIDLIILNAIMTPDGPVFFDQEFNIPSLPARVIMLKNIDMLYRDESLQDIYPARMLWDRYGITEHESLYRLIEHNFWKKLVNYDKLADYYAALKKNTETVVLNRFCMNYPERARESVLTDIFADADGKELYVFGAGRWADKFIAMYRHECRIAGIVDNDPKKHGTVIYGLPVRDPEILRSLDPDKSKVIVCVRHWIQIVRQLLALGIKNVGVYNASRAYPLHKNRQMSHNAPDGYRKKKYGIGYVAGVFDLFHLGHLNLLRRAKEECEYLIVGVVTDEGVRMHKRIEPVTPFEERLEVVRACRYVDEAVEIPLLYCDTQDAWRKFQFDAQFSGSDYSNDPLWLEKQRFLRERGSDLIFFPYTQATSSTHIKKRIAAMHAAKN